MNRNTPEDLYIDYQAVIQEILEWRKNPSFHYMYPTNIDWSE